MQAPEITPGSDGMESSATAACCLQRAHTISTLPGGDWSAKRIFVPGDPCFLSLVTLTFHLWPWPSNSSEQGIKHDFPVNFAHVRSAVPKISVTNKKNKKVTDSTETEPYLCAITKHSAVMEPVNSRMTNTSWARAPEHGTNSSCCSDAKASEL